MMIDLMNWHEIDKWASETMSKISDDVMARCAITTPIYSENFESDANGALSHEVDTSPGAMG